MDQAKPREHHALLDEGLREGRHRPRRDASDVRVVPAARDEEAQGSARVVDGSDDRHVG